MIKMIFAFIAGALVGGASGYAVCRHICEKEIQSVKKMYQAKIDNLKVTVNSVYGAANIEQMKEKPTSGRYPWGKSTDPMKYPKGLEKSEVDRINKILDDMDYSKPENEEEETMKPFQINPDEFGEDDAYGQAMLDYYEDGTIVDDEGCVLTGVSVRSLVGTHVGDMFDQTDEDVIYIRNPTVMVDYMITRNDGPYFKDDES